MDQHQLLTATLDAHKRHLKGSSLAILLIILDRQAGLTELSKLIGVSAAAVTRISDKLAKQGFAFRKLVAGDHRKWKLQITPKGTAAIEAILQEK